MQSTYPIKRSVLYGVTNKLFVNIFNFMKTHLKFFLKLTCFLLVKGFFSKWSTSVWNFHQIEEAKNGGSIFTNQKNIASAHFIQALFKKYILVVGKICPHLEKLLIWTNRVTKSHFPIAPLLNWFLYDSYNWSDSSNDNCNTAR